MKAPTIAILAALGGFQAVAQQITNTPVWVDARTCNPWAKSHGFPAAAGPGGLFTIALGIIDEITNTALYRMFNPSKQSIETLPANVLAWERYRLNSTYGAFFGNNTETTYPGNVWAVGGLLYGVRAEWGPPPQWAPSLNGDPYIFVVCDDAPYLSKNSNNKLVYTDPYIHAHVQLPGDSIVNDGITTACATNGQSSYNNYNVRNHTRNVIICTKNMNLPLGFTSNGPTTFASGTTVDVAGKSWLGALYTQALNTESITHGFAASHAIRNTQDAVYNADSNKFYAFALMFDGLFWGSGVGQTSQQEYASLQKTAAGKRIISAFGLANIAVPARGITWTNGWTRPNIIEPQNRHIGAIPTA
ncbi:hypothetical protein GGI43DRAFT_415465 [Trichoderma evansii]